MPQGEEGAAANKKPNRARRVFVKTHGEVVPKAQCPVMHGKRPGSPMDWKITILGNMVTLNSGKGGGLWIGAADDLFNCNN